jgi:hypothetical protein
MGCSESERSSRAPVRGSITPAAVRSGTKAVHRSRLVSDPGRNLRLEETTVRSVCHPPLDAQRS